MKSSAVPDVSTASPNVAGLRESATIAVSSRAKALRAAGRPVIDLGAGEPDFPTPPYVLEAAQRALEAGATRYTQVEGILPLREVIAARASALLGSPLDATNIVISAGTKQALFNVCFALFGAGDEVLVPTPAWTSYYQILTLSRATPIAVRGDRARHLKATVDELRAAATERTRGIVLNSPSNPTGAVYSRTELEAIVAFANERGWWIVSDEIYREISYDAPATSLLSVSAGSRTIGRRGWRSEIICDDGMAHRLVDFCRPRSRARWQRCSHTQRRTRRRHRSTPRSRRSPTPHRRAGRSTCDGQ